MAGNEVSDLSDGSVDEVELQVYEAYFRGFGRAACERRLFDEVFELCDEDRLRWMAVSESITPSYSLLNVTGNTSAEHETHEASVNAGLRRKSMS